MAHTTCKKKALRDVETTDSTSTDSTANPSTLKISTSATEVSDVTGLLDIQEVHLSFQRHSPVASIEFLGWA